MRLATLVRLAALGLVAALLAVLVYRLVRGPRSGIILSNDEALAKKLNSAIFPGLQGGPLMHIIAAKAVAFAEAMTPEFKAYAKAVVENAKALAATLQAGMQLEADVVTDSRRLIEWMFEPLFTLTGKSP